ncbi:MAG: hypothetical protein JXD23_12645 [Spirochaetales bacterium]|nr:hypothetical protein [Spirochaetales bacterium]
MIVPMKKVMVFVTRREEERALKQLKALGVLHVDAANRESTPLAELLKARDEVERALRTLQSLKKKKIRPDEEPKADALAGAREINAIRERLDRIGEEARGLDDELDRLAPWGFFDPDSIRALRARGIDIGLYELSPDDVEKLPPGMSVIPVARKKGLAYVLAVTLESGGPEPPFRQVRLPAESTAALGERLRRARSEERRLQAELAARLSLIPALERALAGREEAVEFERVRLTFDAGPEVLYLGGFIPVTVLKDVQAEAARRGWGLLVSDPGPEDDVPVLVDRPLPVKVIKPVFDFLGTVPGYREYDVSFPFLFFFAIFFAMLVGDAGYGALFLLFTLLGRLVLKKIPAQLFGLLLITSAATVIYGAITGTWFGDKSIAEAPFFRDLVIGPIATFSQSDNRQFMMLICFIIGLVQLSLAHLISIIRFWKAFRGLAEIGRLGIVWGMFLMVLNLVLSQPLHPAAVWLIIGGLALVVLFERQKPGAGRERGLSGRILAFAVGVGKGFANLFLTALSAVSSLADIISYVRLFAVGLATVEIARTFNGMAVSMGGGLGAPGILVSAFVLFIGHALNMVLSLMSVLVHGLRLNMLEFSSHLGMEWSGRPYQPFAERGEENR